MAGNTMSTVASLWGTQSLFLSLKSEDNLSKDWPSVLSYSYSYSYIRSYTLARRNRGNVSYSRTAELQPSGVGSYKELQRATTWQ